MRSEPPDAISEWAAPRVFSFFQKSTLPFTTRSVHPRPGSVPVPRPRNSEREIKSGHICTCQSHNCIPELGTICTPWNHQQTQNPPCPLDSDLLANLRHWILPWSPNHGASESASSIYIDFSSRSCEARFTPDSSRIALFSNEPLP